jgi:NADPH:quinone reductase
MRAVVVTEFGGPESLRIVEVPEPEPGPGEVTIAVSHAGVGFVDALFRRGAFASLLPAPLTPGIEVSGLVRAVGAGVELAVGAPVAALLNDFGRGARAGGYAEVALARADLVVPIEPGPDAAVAAAAFAVNGATARWALQRTARVAPGEDVVVLGASGGLGSVALPLARAAGARRVIAVVGRRSSEDAVRVAGATDVVLRGELDGALQALTDGRGVDVVVDPVGGPARKASFAALAPFGRLVVVGNASGEDVAVSTDGVWHAMTSVAGFSLGAAAGLTPALVASEARAALAELGTGSEGVEVVDLDEVVEVHRALDENRAATKTVLQVR